MTSFVSRQPSGLLCRFSTVVDSPTNCNMTEDEYIELCAERGREEAMDVVKNYLYPFEEVKKMFVPGNVTKKEFNRCLKMMETKIEP
ncbi:MAG: hypothetical protein RR854_00045 [Muribaculaceae bacterium]